MAGKKGFSLPRLTKDEKKQLTEWALEHSDGVKDFRFWLAVGTYCAASSITEQYGTDTEASRQMSQALSRKYPELAEVAKSRATELISKAVIGKLVNRGTSGEASTRVVEAFSELLGLEEFKIWEYLCELGRRALGERQVTHVPLGHGAIALLSLTRQLEAMQRGLKDTEQAIATLLDRSMQYSDLSGFMAAYNARYAGRLDRFLEECNTLDEGMLQPDEAGYISGDRWRELLSNPYTLIHEEILSIEAGILAMEESLPEDQRRCVTYDFIERLRDGIAEPISNKTTHLEENGTFTGGHGMI